MLATLRGMDFDKSVNHILSETSKGCVEVSLNRKFHPIPILSHVSNQKAFCLCQQICIKIFENLSLSAN